MSKAAGSTRSSAARSSRGSARASMPGECFCRSRSRASATCSRTTGARPTRSAPSARSPSRRAPCATPRTARRSFAEVERRYGFATRLLSGDEEAELTRRGVGAVDDGTLVLDVGGGSTELDPRRLPHEPRRRLRAADRAPSPERPADPRGALRRGRPRPRAAARPRADSRDRRRGHGRPAPRARRRPDAPGRRA